MFDISFKSACKMTEEQNALQNFQGSLLAADDFASNLPSFFHQCIDDHILFSGSFDLWIDGSINLLERLIVAFDVLLGPNNFWLVGIHGGWWNPL